MNKALIVEDEAFALEDLRDSLTEIVPNVQITGVRTATEAMDTLATETFDAIFLDIELPGMSGIEMLQRIRQPLPPVVLVTAHALLALDAFGLGVVECLLKPVDQQRLRKAVAKIQNLPPVSVVEYSDQTGVLHPDDRFFVRNGERLWLVRVGDILRIEDEGEGLKIFFRGETGTVKGDPTEFRSRLDPRVFYHSCPHTTINVEAVDHFLQTPGGRLVAQFGDGWSIEFDAERSKIFADAYGI